MGALLGSFGAACEGEAVHHVWLVTVVVSQRPGPGAKINLAHDAGVTAIPCKVRTAGDRYGGPEQRKPSDGTTQQNGFHWQMCGKIERHKQHNPDYSPPGSIEGQTARPDSCCAGCQVVWPYILRMPAPVLSGAHLLPLQRKAEG